MLEQQSQTLTAGQNAGFGERFVAYIIDGVILGVMQFVLRMALGPGVGVVALTALIGIVYTVGFWSAGGATPGKMLMKLQVVRDDGGEVGIGEAAMRYVGYIVSAITLGLGFLAIIWDEKHRGWHDRIAGTRVIKIG